MQITCLHTTGKYRKLEQENEFHRTSQHKIVWHVECCEIERVCKNYPLPCCVLQQAKTQMMKIEEKWRYLPKHVPTSKLYIEENAWWYSSVCKLYSKLHMPSFDPWIQCMKAHLFLNTVLPQIMWKIITILKVISHCLSARDPTIVPNSMEEPKPAIKSCPISPFLYPYVV